MHLSSIGSRNRLTCATTALLCIGASPAFGQIGSTVQASAEAETVGESAGDGTVLRDAGPVIEDIVVTAERRETNIQRTPIAISAIEGGSLRAKQLVNVESLASQIPNLTFSRSGADSKVFIRGIGLDSASPGSDPRVAIYTDGVYNPRSQAALSSLFDLQRIEVLSGPQGTLYGRNATAGAMNIISREPGKFLNGYGTLTAGNYGLLRTEGAVGGPLSDTVSARLAFQTSDRNGYGKNIQSGEDVDDEHSRAVRAKLAFHPSSALDIKLTGDYRREKDHSFGYHFLRNVPGFTQFSQALGYRLASNPRDTAGPGPLTFVESYGSSGTLTLDLGGATVTAISGWRHINEDYKIAADQSTSGFAPLFIRSKSDALSQELRVADKIGPLDVLVGAYYFHEKLDTGIGAALSQAYFGLPSFDLIQGTLSGGRQVTNAYALFTQETLHIADGLGLDLGLRYSKEKRRTAEHSQVVFAPYDLTAPFFAVDPSATLINQRATWSSTNPKVTLHYQVNDSVFTYATYSVGFKSGGFNIGGLQPPFNPEKLTNFEVGLKTDLFDHRLRANLAGFWYDYKNLQVNIVEGIQNITRNAAKARLYGVEADFTALPLDDLQLSLNASWLHSEYLDYVTPDPLDPMGTPLQLAGNQLNYAPKYKISGEAAYTFHSGIGDITPRINLLYIDRIYFDQFNHLFVSQKARTELNLYVDLVSDDTNWSVNLFVKNATNDLYESGGTLGAPIFNFAVTGLVGAPQTFGGSITRRF